jgi:hypothetical protein
VDHQVANHYTLACCKSLQLGMLDGQNKTQYYIIRFCLSGTVTTAKIIRCYSAKALLYTIVQMTFNTAHLTPSIVGLTAVLIFIFISVLSYWVPTILKDKTVAETSPKCSEFSSKLQRRRKIQS